MMSRFRAFLLVLAMTPLAAPASDVAAAHGNCAPNAHETPIATETGSVGIIKNLAEDPSSIRAIAGRLLNDALMADSKNPNAECDTACARRANSQIVYRVAPTAYLADEQQLDVCRKFENETTSHPLTFNQREFRSVDEINEWIMAFSQGRGEDGRLLSTVLIQLQSALHLPHRRAECRLRGAHRGSVRPRARPQQRRLPRIDRRATHLRRD